MQQPAAPFSNFTGWFGLAGNCCDNLGQHAAKPRVMCVVLCAVCRAQAEDLFRQQAQRDVDSMMAAKQQEELK